MNFGANVSNVHTLRGNGNFRVAHAIISDIGSATDFRPIDVASTTDEGGTDLDLTRHAFEQKNWFFQKSLRIAEDVSSTSSTASDIFFWKEDKAKFLPSMGDFAALDYLRTAEGQIEQQIRGLGRTAG